MTFGKAAGQASWQGRVRSTQGGNELASIVNAFSTVNTALRGRLVCEEVMNDRIRGAAGFAGNCGGLRAGLSRASLASAGISYGRKTLAELSLLLLSLPLFIRLAGLLLGTRALVCTA